jgi:hypothetical protein
MTPEGYRQIQEALPDTFIIEPEVQEGENVPFVTVDHVVPRERARVLNSLSAANLLVNPYERLHEDTNKPMLKLAVGLATETTITFVDLDSSASENIISP